jgi:hypothetical protein
MARKHDERKSLMKLQVDSETQNVLRELAAGDRSMGRLLDDLAPALLAEREHIESGGGDRSPVTAVIRRAMIQRQLREASRE